MNLNHKVVSEPLCGNNVFRFFKNYNASHSELPIVIILFTACFSGVMWNHKCREFLDAVKTIKRIDYEY